MTTTANGNGSPVPLRDQLRDAKAKRRLLEEQIAAKRLESQQALLESWGDSWAWARGMDSEVYFRTQFGADPDGYFYPPDNADNRSGGADWPLYRNEQQLGRLRLRSALLARTNAYARGLVRNLVNYTTGEGGKYKIVTKEGLPDADPGKAGRQAPPGLDAEMAKCQDILDSFLARNRWNASADYRGNNALASTREREAARRTIVQGEAIVRLFFRSDGLTDVRFVESAQLTNPPDAAYGDGWAFGIRHRVDRSGEDEEDRQEYHVAYKNTEFHIRDGRSEPGERVPATEIVHLTGPDTDAALKRGLPEFSFDAADALERAARCERNASLGAAFRALTAEIWQHDYGTQDQVSRLATGLSSGTRQDPYTGRTRRVEHDLPAQVRRVPEGQKVVSPPADNTGSYLQAVQGDLRQAAASTCAPEYLASGDASNANYSSTKEAGTPFVQQAKALQGYFVTAYQCVAWKVLAWAAECGLIARATLDLIDVQVTLPEVAARDEAAMAAVNQIKVQGGAKSRQTWCQENGDDWDVERANMHAYEDEFGQEGQALGLPGEGGVPEGAPFPRIA